MNSPAGINNSQAIAPLQNNSIRNQVLASVLVALGLQGAVTYANYQKEAKPEHSKACSGAFTRLSQLQARANIILVSSWEAQNIKGWVSSLKIESSVNNLPNLSLINVDIVKTTLWITAYDQNDVPYLLSENQKDAIEMEFAEMSLQYGCNFHGNEITPIRRSPITINGREGFATYNYNSILAPKEVISI